MRIQAVELAGARMAEQLAFYTQVLGLPLLETGPDRFAVQAGATRLAFRRVAGGEPPLHHFAFNIPENQLPAAADWVRARMPLLTGDGQELFDFPNWNAHALYFADPDGNVVEFIARHDLATASERPFSGRSILSVSEVGVVVDAVGPALDRLQAELGLPQYWGDREAFAAMGDPEGLFIVVRTGRGWYPVGWPATVHPVEVAVDCGLDRPAELTLGACRIRAQ